MTKLNYTLLQGVFTSVKALQISSLEEINTWITVSKSLKVRKDFNFRSCFSWKKTDPNHQIKLFVKLQMAIKNDPEGFKHKSDCLTDFVNLRF